MKIILKNNIDKLGLKYEVVNVKPGFAMNYLIPRGKAIIATPSEIKHNKDILKQMKIKLQHINDLAKETVKKLNNIILRIKVKTDINGQILDKIDRNYIYKVLSKRGVNIEKNNIILPRKKINTRGKYSAKIKFHINMETILNFELI